MRIIISPAKKMNVDVDGLPWRQLPVFLDDTKEILSKLQSMDYDSLKKLWKCSDKLTEENVTRLADMNLESPLTPAILSYEGIQYQYMSPSVFSGEELEYIQEHLRILSGFYGILKPFDGVTPYRLEMQAKLPLGDNKDLYGYWGSTLSDHITMETDCIINLASKEYSVAISKHLPEHVQMITCVFGEKKEGKIIEKGTLCKMARGEMVRYMAEHQIRESETIKGFDRLNYKFSEEDSDENTYVFLQP